MKPQKYYIYCENDNKKYWKETEGWPIKNDYGLDLFCHRYEDALIEKYRISEARTGRVILTRQFKKHCTLDAFSEWLYENSLIIDTFKKSIEKHEKKHGKSPLYQ